MKIEKHRNRAAALAGSTTRLFDQLEARNLLSPTLTNFTVSDPVVVAGQSLTLSVDVAPGGGESVTAATFFNDVNGNGRWDSGVDVDLGASFSPATGSTYRRTVTVPGGWTGTVNLVADALSSNGSWAASRPTQSVAVNVRPTVTSFTAPGSGSSGTPLTLTTDAADSDGTVRAVTWFLDANSNGVWDTGVDTSLATSFTPTSGSTYTASVTPGSNWPVNASIVSDAQDNNLDWASATQYATIVVSGVSSRPVVSALTVAQDYSQDGKRMTATVTATDNSAILAATFFVDNDGNGAWTPNVDQSLGTSYTASGTNQYSLTFTHDFNGHASMAIVADVVDHDGLWASARGTVTVQNDGAWTRFVEVAPTATGGGSTTFTVRAQFSYPDYFARASTVTAYGVVFLDLNGNNIFNDGVDTLVGVQNVNATRNAAALLQQSGVSVLDSQIAAGAHFAAFVSTGSTSSDFAANAISPTRVGTVIQDNSDEPRISSQTVTVGSVSVPAVAGSAYSVTGNWDAGRGGNAVTLFWDANMNGRWDSGTDRDLGWVAISGASGTYSFSGTVASAMAGTGAFTVAVKDSGGEWGMTYSDRSTQIFTAPTLSNGTSAGGTAGSTITIDVDVSDDIGLRAATGFIDVNGNGLFDGSDATYSGTTYSLLSGTRTSGRMRLTINTSGLSAGTYTVYLAGTDFYIGDSNAASGGSTTLWSSRVGVSITLT